MDSKLRDQWNSRFDQDEFAYGTEPNTFLRDMAERLVPSADVLSLGDGEGRNGVHLARQGHRVTAVDIAEAGLGKARRLAARHGVSVETVHADLAEFDLGTERWHAVVSIFCHLPSALRRQVLAGAVRGLRPGGLLILEGYTPRQLRHGTGGPKDPDLLLEPDTLREELAGLELTHFIEVEREIREGMLHTGTAAVLQVVARKPTD
jgi:SAM-dependent methyltransferase